MRTKTALIASIMFLSCLLLTAQQELDVKGLKTETIELSYNKQFLTPTIANIDVFDARPDTFSVGVIDRTEDGHRLSKKPLSDYYALVLPTSLKNTIGRAIIPMYGTKKSGFSIFLAIKELWFYDNDISSLVKNGTLTGASTSGVMFRADIYLERGNSFIPLFQVDSVFITRTFLQRSTPLLLQTALNALCEKLNNFPLMKAYNQATRVKTMAEIDSFYNHSQELNVLKFTDSSRQYVFKTFDDFKEGKHSEAVLSKVSDKLGDYYYEKDDVGKESLMKDFAFVDKCRIYIRTNNTYSPILINKNRVYTIGSKFIVAKSVSLPIYMPLGASGGYNWYGYTTNGIQVGSASRRDYQLMMLDMKTGNFY